MKDILKKVTFEYENRIETLEGKQAQEWLTALNGQVMLNSIHGSYFPEFKWKIEKKHEK